MNVVYVKNFENGKKYVGITNNFERRMSQHKSRAKDNDYQHLPLYRAMSKYTHYTDVVFESELYDDVLYMEQIVIQNFKDLGIDLYNCTDGGEGTKGLSRYGKDSAMYGKSHTEEYKLKISASRKGKTLGANNINYKPKEYYINKASTRSNFKRICKSQGWLFDNFEEVFSGELAKDSHKKFYYIYKGE